VELSSSLTENLIILVGFGISMIGNYFPEPLRGIMVVGGFGLVFVYAIFSEYILKLIVADYSCLKVTLDSGATFYAYLEAKSEDEQVKPATWVKRFRSHWPIKLKGYGMFHEFQIESDVLPTKARLKFGRRLAFFWGMPIMHGLVAHIFVREYESSPIDRWRDESVPCWKLATSVEGDSAAGLPLPTDFILGMIKHITENVQDPQQVIRRIFAFTKEVEKVEFFANAAHERGNKLLSLATQHIFQGQSKDAQLDGILSHQTDSHKGAIQEIGAIYHALGNFDRAYKALVKRPYDWINWKTILAATALATVLVVAFNPQLLSGFSSFAETNAVAIAVIAVAGAASAWAAVTFFKRRK